MSIEAIDAAPDEKKSSKWLSCLIEAAIILVAVVLVWLLRTHVYETAIVTSGSMQPTLYKDDRALVDHRASLHGHWRRGDVVIFNGPPAWGDNDDQMLVKRVIGLPGENIELKNGQVFIDGRQLTETYIKEPMEADSFGPFHLGATQYFVMGDNRRNSEDSRINGPVDDKYMHGRFTVVVAPLAHAGRMPLPEY